jgi:hypothetical protein
MNPKIPIEVIAKIIPKRPKIGFWAKKDKI